MDKIKYRAFDGECFWFTNETMSFFKYFGGHQSSFDDYMEFSEVVEAGWTIDQYIGVDDIHGVEIYERDRVKDERSWVSGIVVYDPAIFRIISDRGIFVTTGYPEWDYFEVIGNIHSKE